MMPNIDQLANGKQLREEVTNLDQFNAIGNTKDVAKKYGVSVGTAHGLKISLKAKKAREAVDNILDAHQGSNMGEDYQVYLETETEELQEVELDETVNITIDESEECQPGNLCDSCAEAVNKNFDIIEASKTNSDQISRQLNAMGDCVKDSDPDVCAPNHSEPSVLSNEGLERLITDLEEHWKKPKKDIEELWESITAGIRTLHKMHLNQAEMEFQERLAGVIEEC